MDIYVAAGRRIRALREFHKYSREQFAELVEISTKFLYEIETGKKGFSAYTLFKMSEVLGVSSDYILIGKCEVVGTDELNMLVGRFNPKQIRKIEELLTIIYEMSDGI